MSNVNKKLLNQIEELKKQIGTVFVGKEKEIHYLLIGFFSGLHVLIEDIPGVGKTTLSKILAKSSGLDLSRIQFTPDLLPGDVIGMTVWSIEKHDFIFKEGAIMHQFILADEINRASARTQSSLLEAMQEGAITVDGKTYRLPEPFFVIATQNPVSFAGTFQLPEAQVDRFGISFSLGYPDENEEMIILERFREEDLIDKKKAVITSSEIIKINELIRKVHADEKLKSYLVKIANQTRNNSLLKLGMSPRATQHLLRASQAEAFLSGRDFIIPEDVINVSKIVLGHRLIISAEAKMENKGIGDILDSLMREIAIPTGL